MRLESAPNKSKLKISENAIGFELQIEAVVEVVSTSEPKPPRVLVVVVVVVVVVGFLSNPIGLLLTTELTAAMTTAVVGSSLYEEEEVSAALAGLLSFGMLAKKGETRFNSSFASSAIVVVSTDRNENRLLKSLRAAETASESG